MWEIFIYEQSNKIPNSYYKTNKNGYTFFWIKRADCLAIVDIY